MSKKISVAEPDLSGNESAYLQDALLNERRVSSRGKYLDRFAKEFAEYCGRTYALPTSNGTTALHLALIGLGIGPGDEVIVPTFTFAATAAVVCHVGATPVFIDAKEGDWTLNEAQLDKIKTPHTKALITVDIYGTPCDYDYIEAWCKKNDIFLIEDAAEAHGAVYNDRRVGSFGDVSCFSFFGNKIITTGEGGMCLTNDPTLYERMRVFANHGMDVPGVYEHAVIGHNFRMTNIQAAVGCAQLERIGEFLQKRKEHDALYRKLLSDVVEISFQPIPKGCISAFWFFNILLSGYDIPRVREGLAYVGIETRPLFLPLHKQRAYMRFVRDATFPVADKLCASGLTFPSSPLLTQEDIEFIVAEFKKIIIKTSIL